MNTTVFDNITCEGYESVAKQILAGQFNAFECVSAKAIFCACAHLIKTNQWNDEILDVVFQALIPTAADNYYSKFADYEWILALGAAVPDSIDAMSFLVGNTVKPIRADDYFRAFNRLYAELCKTNVFLLGKMKDLVMRITNLGDYTPLTELENLKDYRINMRKFVSHLQTYRLTAEYVHDNLTYTPPSGQFVLDNQLSEGSPLRDLRIEGHKLIATPDKVQARLSYLTNGLIETIPHSDKVAFAGGSVSACLFNDPNDDINNDPVKYCKKYVHDNSDVDVWVCSLTQPEKDMKTDKTSNRTDTIVVRDVINHFAEGDGTTIVSVGSVVSVFNPTIGREIQIISTSETSPAGVVESFDSSNVKIVAVMRRIGDFVAYDQNTVDNYYPTNPHNKKWALDQYRIKQNEKGIPTTEDDMQRFYAGNKDEFDDIMHEFGLTDALMTDIVTEFLNGECGTAEDVLPRGGRAIYGTHAPYMWYSGIQFYMSPEYVEHLCSLTAHMVSVNPIADRIAKNLQRGWAIAGDGYQIAADLVANKNDPEVKNLFGKTEPVFIFDESDKNKRDLLIIKTKPGYTIRDSVDDVIENMSIGVFKGGDYKKQIGGGRSPIQSLDVAKFSRFNAIFGAAVKNTNNTYISSSKGYREFLADVEVSSTADGKEDSSVYLKFVNKEDTDKITEICSHISVILFGNKNVHKCFKAGVFKVVIQSDAKYSPVRDTYGVSITTASLKTGMRGRCVFSLSVHRDEKKPEGIFIDVRYVSFDVHEHRLDNQESAPIPENVEGMELKTVIVEDF